MAAEWRQSEAGLAGAIIAVLFVRAEAISVSELAHTLELTREAVEQVIETGADLLQGTGLMLQRHRDELQLVTHPQAAWAVERALRPEVAGRLSKPALETLAIIAYRQPVTRVAIEAIRGVNCEAVLESLSRHGLIDELGRVEGPGRPRLFGTTLRFLQVVGISQVDDLPPLGGPDPSSWLGRAAEIGEPDAD
ncbi:MAG TPA: SMC-Scp complex subunit ScpB [Candidatus Dormibacteraeota bacterium]|nr:SMC-Scp complex subunit ScpB [Candidatus Dormibacteraeota bacterium]